MASHVADSERSRGMSSDEARSIGYATVNKFKRGGRKARKSHR